MTYQDPNDPLMNDRLRSSDPSRLPPQIVDDESSSMWGWIAGAVVVVLLAFALIGFLGRSDNVATNDGVPSTASPSSTVGQAPATRPTSPLNPPSATPTTPSAPNMAPSNPAPAQ